MSVAALIVAAGSGDRFAGDLPKQYQALAGQPLLRHSLETFAGHSRVDRVNVVINPDHEQFYSSSIVGLDVGVVAGGPTRQESVLCGLQHLAGDKPEHVLIHDGARPLIDPDTIDRVIGGLADHDAVVPVLPISDSVKLVGPAGVDATMDRRGLWRAQTPQGFRYAAILAASKELDPHVHYDDDASVALEAGYAVAVVVGSETNLKVTFPQDLEYAERLLQSGLSDVRVGTGFDTHRFIAGDRVRLCGVDIPAPASLAGHSDADVGLHAITDALLGALGEGDIGEHFPPHDDRWRDADSQTFIRHAAHLVRKRGGVIAHVDVTLICERPKVKEHRQRMREVVAGILSLPTGRISVKATTTEKLGFVGRGEGIAAQAAATVRLPFGGKEAQ